MAALSSVAWLLAAGPSSAHEVAPSVADLTIGADEVTIAIEWVLEAPVAGIDLEGLQDTNEADGAERYDELRALPPEGLAAAFRQAWPQLRERVILRAGETRVPLQLSGVAVPAGTDPDYARVSTVALAAALPPDGTPVVFGWDAALGPLVVRQQGVEDGYSAYLDSGRLTDPIPRVGGSTQGPFAAFAEYVVVGFDHIIPKGLDHILFVLGLFFLSIRLRPLLAQVTAFTFAHTVTLALGALEIVRIPASIVEPLIAASIVYVGLENVLSRGLTPWRPVVVFFFGLLHGLGFASVLTEFGLGFSHFVPKLIGFNVGVELGQLTVIAAAFLALGLWFGHQPWFKRMIADPASIAIAAVGSWWLVERTLL